MPIHSAAPRVCCEQRLPQEFCANLPQISSMGNWGFTSHSNYKNIEFIVFALSIFASILITIESYNLF